MKVEIEVRCTDDNGIHTAEKMTRLGDFDPDVPACDSFMVACSRDTMDMLQRAKNGFRFHFDEAAFNTAVQDGTF